MLPSLTRRNQADVATTDAKYKGDFSVAQLVQANQALDAFNLIVVKFGLRIAFATRHLTMFAGVFLVTSMRDVFEIAKSIVGFVARNMVDFRVFRTRANKRQHNNGMDAGMCRLVSFGQRDTLITAPAVHWLQYTVKTATGRIAKTLNATLITDFIQSFVTRDRFPCFIRHLSFSFAGFASRRGGQAAKQAVQAGSYSALVHRPIIAREGIVRK